MTEILRKYQNKINIETEKEIERKHEPIQCFILGSTLGLITFIVMRLIEIFLG